MAIYAASAACSWIRLHNCTGTTAAGMTARSLSSTVETSPCPVNTNSVAAGAATSDAAVQPDHAAGIRAASTPARAATKLQILSAPLLCADVIVLENPEQRLCSNRSSLFSLPPGRACQELLDSISMDACDPE